MREAALERELITPEGVDLRLNLGDAGERVAAFLLDVLAIGGMLASLTVIVFVLGFVFHFRPASISAMSLIWLLGFFLLRNFYFIAFELTPRAATPGKRATGLRVASRDGRPLSGNAIFARNAMRELEVFLPLAFMASNAQDIDAWISIAGLIWCGAFVFFPLFNRDRLRLGDLVAGTWVVKAPRRVLDNELDGGRSIVFDQPALDAYGIKELTILEDVLRRKDATTMREVAKRIRAKIQFIDDVADDEFLSAYYVALRGRLESRLLFGQRRRDKFDRS